MLIVIILVSTVSVFIDYFIKNHAVREKLTHLPPSLLIFLLLMYFGTMIALALINVATLKLCNIKSNPKEIWLLTAYSSVINFFGPLQSGPAVRAVYLKKKYDLNLKKYTIATFVYYFFFASISGIFLLSGLLKWWLVPLSFVGLLILFGLSKHHILKSALSQIDLRSWYLIALATMLQISLLTIIYYTEVRAINPSVHLSQVIIYTGASNFALFVSITPGAIGFREAFLAFSKRLHHISYSVILAANILDRAVYIVFLLILAALILMTHAGKFLGVKNAKTS